MLPGVPSRIPLPMLVGSRSELALDLRQHPAVRAEVLEIAGESPKTCPGLLSGQFEVIAGPGRGNCIGFVVGLDRDRWPGSRVRDFDRFFAKHNFTPVEGLDFSVDPKRDKIVLYGVAPSHPRYRDHAEMAMMMGGQIDRGPIVTHAALQSPDGGWLGKLNTGPTLKVRTPDAFSGELYGAPIRVYSRARA